jgi:hypothetical protein
MSVKVYNADQVKILIGGFPVDSGMGADEVARIEKDEDDLTVGFSADGEGDVSINNNKWHTLTLTCKRTSGMNVRLSALHKAGQITPAGVLVVPVAVVDAGSNGDLFVAHQAVILRMPDETFGREVSELEWAFKVHNPERFIAGH